MNCMRAEDFAIVAWQLSEVAGRLFNGDIGKRMLPCG